jgi:hypothetical protein
MRFDMQPSGIGDLSPLCDPSSAGSVSLEAPSNAMASMRLRYLPMSTPASHRQRHAHPVSHRLASDEGE